MKLSAELDAAVSGVSPRKHLNTIMLEDETSRS